MSVLQHFRTEERPFIQRVEDWIDLVQRRHQPYVTDFLNPRERFIFSMLARRQADVTFSFDGGYDQAEYERCLLAPDYWQPQPEEFDLCFLQITGSTKFQTLEHRDYLGALMNLGLKRDKLGDLLIQGDTCQLVTTREMGAFIRMNLHQVHRVNVSIVEVKRESLNDSQKNMQKQTVTVASTRLDAVLSATFSFSRNKIVPLIRSGKCKVNWKVEENPAASVAPGDTLSLRGSGRAYVLSLDGQTRRGRLRMTVGKPR